MQQELKTKWIKALRSGKYKQGQHRLRFNNNFCCLGVLCDVIDPLNWIVVKVQNDELYLYAADGYNEYTLPTDLSFKIGLCQTLQQALAYCNDSKNLSFEQIAEWIETNISSDEDIFTRENETCTPDKGEIAPSTSFDGLRTGQAPAIRSEDNVE